MGYNFTISMIACLSLAVRSLRLITLVSCVQRRNIRHLQDFPVQRSYGYSRFGLEPDH